MVWYLGGWQPLPGIGNTVLEFQKQGLTSHFFFSFFSVHTCSIWKFPGQRSNLCWSFEGSTRGIWRYTGLGSNQSCCCRPTPQPQQRQIWATSATYTTAHGNTGSLTHWERPRIKPKTSWFLVGFVSSAPRWELQHGFLNPLLQSWGSNLCSYRDNARSVTCCITVSMPHFALCTTQLCFLRRQRGRLTTVIIADIYWVLRTRHSKCFMYINPSNFHNNLSVD